MTDRTDPEAHFQRTNLLKTGIFPTSVGAQRPVSPQIRIKSEITLENRFALFCKDEKSEDNEAAFHSCGSAGETGTRCRTGAVFLTGSRRHFLKETSRPALSLQEENQPEFFYRQTCPHRQDNRKAGISGKNRGLDKVKD